jgi:type IX secretion system PorP/SprF family membrane protein
MKQLFVAISLLLLGFVVKAQDIHFSQYGIIQSYLNPAITGVFDADYRFAGIHRNQWRSVSTPYSTFGMSAEKNGFKKIKNLGLGIVFLNDVAGTSQFTTNRINLNLAYHFKLSDESKTLSLGIQPEFITQNFDISKLQFGDQFIGGIYQPQTSTDIFSDVSGSGFNLTSGVHFNKTNNWLSGYSIGGAAANILEPVTFPSAVNPFGIKFLGYGNYQFELSSKWRLGPSVYYANQTEVSELIVSANGSYIIKNSALRKQALLFGVAYRNQDAVYPSIGFIYNQWQFGLSYDVNTSSLNTASNQRGAYEIGIVYLLSIFNEQHKSFRSCPSHL